MAGGVSPEKVKALLSSFLVNDSKSPDRINPLTGNSFISNDSRLDDSTTESSAQSPNNLTGSLRSFEKFLQRLDTFSISFFSFINQSATWFGKPAELSPIICARYGWENVDSDMLQCVGCKAFLAGQLPSRLDLTAYEESLSKLKKNLLSSHDKFCVLAANPCPEHFCHVPVDDPVNLMTSFSGRVKSLSRIQDRLPHLDETDLQALGYDTAQGAAYCRRNLVPGVDASPQVVALAFSGWACSESDENVLTCSMCRRQIGLWNFVSSSSTVDQKTYIGNGDGDATDDGQSTPKRRKVCLNKKDSLNPLGEHHRWCPWIQEIPLPSSPGNAAVPSSHSDVGRTQQSAPALIVALRCIAPGLMDSNKGFANTMKTSPMVEGLRYFRKILKAWSSPKVHTKTSSPS
ncbi:unnamed protein product [Candidula unifasciata]|uniref:C3HC-type domain-containing protein n=1 Tax=Candidula unifasciata TaxID=100452 RepID=A0A8S3YSF4_9EUPU|nr:unnamed protein product [Candidula unifasciata]